MTDHDRRLLRNLALGLVAALAAVGAGRWWRLRLWRGPLTRVEGKVLSCDSGYASGARGSRGGMRYRTRYEYVDRSGVTRGGSTESLRRCAPPGTALVIEWPEGRPELARAREK